MLAITFQRALSIFCFALLLPPAGAWADLPPVQTTTTETVPLEQMFAILTQDTSQVATDSDGMDFITTDTAQAICTSAFGTVAGGTLASLEQMQTAYEAGAQLCGCGILTDGMAFPMQVASTNCGNADGVISCGLGYKRNRAYCWGARPTDEEVTSLNSAYELLPFSDSQWSQFCSSSTDSDSDCQPEVEQPTGPVFPAGPVPANMYTQAPDDELAWRMARYDQPTIQPYVALLTTDSSVTTVYQEALPATLPTPGVIYDARSAMLMARGRFVSNDADQLVAMTKTGGQPSSSPSQCSTLDYEIMGSLAPPVGSASFPTSNLTACLPLYEGYWAYAAFDLAGGDLDRALDTGGHFHDELVVAFESGDLTVDPPSTVEIAVFDYSAGSGKVTETSYELPVSKPYNRFYRGEDLFDGNLRITTFDAGGLGKRLIAVAHTASSNLGGFETPSLVISILSYAPGSGGQPGNLSHLAAYSVSLATAMEGNMDLAAGDFNGDGLGEIALLRPFAKNGQDYGWKVTILAYAEDSSGKGYVVRLSDTDVTPPDHDSNQNMGRLAVGTFHFDPEHGYQLGRQQLAVALSPQTNGAQKPIEIATYIVDGSFDLQPKASYTTPGVNGGSMSDMAAGGFAGVHADPANPITGIAISYYGTNGHGWVDYLAGDTLKPTAQVDSGDDGVTTKYTLLAYDADGDSLVLGAPVGFVADQSMQVSSILAQPPQHLDYLPNDTGANDDGLLNVSRDPGFTLTFSDQTNSTMSSQQKSTDSWNIGASADASATLTLSEKIPLLEKGSLSATLAGKLSYAYQSSATSSVGTESTLSIDMSESPVFDDALYATMQGFQIWRYRIYGATNTSDPNQSYGYYEVYSPEGVGTNGWYGGSMIDAYQPIHENGNVLSYPDIQDASSGPVDLGSWSPTLMPPGCDTPAGVPVETTPFTDAGQEFTYSGVKQSLTVTLDQEQTCGNQRSSSNTLAGGLDVNFRLLLKENVIFAESEEKGHLNVRVDGGGSWGGLSSSQTVNTSSDSLTISTVALGDTDQSYNFMPVAYFSGNGALKVNFYAGLPTNDQHNWWQKTYGAPDPALNLPGKFISTDNGQSWTLNTALDAQRLRGFFLRDGESVDSATGLGPLLTEVPTQGDKVQVEARVYNYSANTSFSALPVRFDVARYDSLTDSVSDRQVLPTVVTAQYTNEAENPGGPNLSPEFPPRGVGRALYTIDTGSLGSLTLAEGLNQLVVYAVLNPEADAPTQETHGWRSANVFVTPNTKGTENAGSTLTLSFEDQSGNPLDAVSITTQGDPATDIVSFAQALSTLASKYGFEANPFPAQTSQTQPEKLVLTGGRELPSPTIFTASLQLPEAIDGVTALQVIPTVTVTGGGNATLTASNLLSGQNNSGYGFLSVFMPAQSGAAVGDVLAVAPDGLALRDASGGLVTESARVPLGEPARGRLCVTAPEGTYPGVIDVPIFDGDATDGQGVAIKRLHGVDSGGSCTWFTWIPRDAGSRQLTALLPSGDTETLSVTVTD